jgi:hypothetical protein
MIGKGKRKGIQSLVGSNAFDSRVQMKYPNKKRKDKR